MWFDGLRMARFGRQLGWLRSHTSIQETKTAAAHQAICAGAAPLCTSVKVVSEVSVAVVVCGVVLLVIVVEVAVVLVALVVVVRELVSVSVVVLDSVVVCSVVLLVSE